MELVIAVVIGVVAGVVAALKVIAPKTETKVDDKVLAAGEKALALVPDDLKK